VEIPQQGDARKLWKIEATRALPLFRATGDCRARNKLDDRFTQGDSSLGD
jgi:hypothetical protein